ncbi:hypothetical protein [Filifactor alocis]|uniref:hypothetical protein n=1 Tax=Filifactor alocis TaxID=143361 RepID=UPI003F9FC1FB
MILDMTLLIYVCLTTIVVLPVGCIMIYSLTCNEDLCKVWAGFYVVIVFVVLTINVSLNQQKLQESYLVTKTNVVAQSYDRILQRDWVYDLDGKEYLVVTNGSAYLISKKHYKEYNISERNFLSEEDYGLFTNILKQELRENYERDDENESANSFACRLLRLAGR